MEAYDKLIIKLDDIHQSGDKEMEHIFQDEIYRKFIKDIANNKFKTIREIREVARDLNKNVVKKDMNRQYA
jgi:hypothetical protein